MAIVRITRPTREQYMAVNARVSIETRHPVGLLAHAAGEVDGGWQIVDIWEAEEYAAQFERDVLGPAVEDVTGAERRAPVISYELEQLVLP